MFFHFLKILVFWFATGVKQQKNGPKWQKILSLTPYISGTIHLMNFIYGTQVKKDISRSFFSFFFFKFQLTGFLVGLKGKNGPKWQKNLSTSYIRYQAYIKHTSDDRDFWYMLVKWWHLQLLISFFQNFDFPGC